MCLGSIWGWKFPPTARCGSGQETKTWQEGECLVFDNSTEHEAWNRSDHTRTILLCDFLNPLRRRPLILNPKFTPELIGYISGTTFRRAGSASAYCGICGSRTNPGLFTGRAPTSRAIGIRRIIRP